MTGAVIAGAGIGGLAAAIALRHAGCEVTVCEREPELREAGAGLTLWPNAVKALGDLGLADAVEAIAAPIDTSRVLRSNGSLIASVDFRDYAVRYGAPAVGIHRGDLLAVLRAQLPAACLRLGASVSGYREGAQGVAALLADGAAVEGTFLIGADGIRSTVRAAMFGDQEARSSRFMAWRGVAPAARVPIPRGEVAVVVAPGSHFGWVPLGGERVYWFGTGEVGGDPDPLRQFGAWAEPVPSLVRATPPEDVLRNELIDRPPGGSWGSGQVTLLGDAAHAMLPGMGQGACQALEDAVAIGASMRGRAGAEIESGLRAYEAARQPRTKRLQQSSKLAFEVFQWRNPVGRAVRDLALRLPQAMMERQNAWVFTDGSRSL